MNPSEHSRALTIRVTENGIQNFAAAQAKMASISEKFLENVLILIVCLFLVLEYWC